MEKINWKIAVALVIVAASSFMFGSWVGLTAPRAESYYIPLPENVTYSLNYDCAMGFFNRYGVGVKVGIANMSYTEDYGMCDNLRDMCLQYMDFNEIDCTWVPEALTCECVLEGVYNNAP